MFLLEGAEHEGLFKKGVRNGCRLRSCVRSVAHELCHLHLISINSPIFSIPSFVVCILFLRKHFPVKWKSLFAFRLRVTCRPVGVSVSATAKYRRDTDPYGVTSPPKFYLRFRCRFHILCLLSAIRHYSFTMWHRTCNIRVSRCDSCHFMLGSTCLVVYACFIF